MEGTAEQSTQRGVHQRSVDSLQKQQFGSIPENINPIDRVKLNEIENAIDTLLAN